MKLNRRRLPIPQAEFGFAPSTFNLAAETGLDGERLIRERDEADRARIIAEAAQATLFKAKQFPEHRPLRRLRASDAPSNFAPRISRIAQSHPKSNEFSDSSPATDTILDTETDTKRPGTDYKK